MRMDEALDPARLGPPADASFVSDTPSRLVRPLLKVPRTTTLAYCTHAGLELVEDPSNRTRAYTRNRVRLDLLPLLEQFNPAIRATLARTAELAADDLAALDRLVAKQLPRVAHDNTFDLRLFRSQPRAVQRRLLRAGIQALTGGLVEVTSSPIEDALDLLQTNGPSRAYHLPYGVELCIEADAFELQREDRARRRQGT